MLAADRFNRVGWEQSLMIEPTKDNKNHVFSSADYIHVL